jgi:hypothetical protein
MLPGASPNDDPHRVSFDGLGLIIRVANKTQATLPAPKVRISGDVPANINEYLIPFAVTGINIADVGTLWRKLAPCR